MRPIGKRRAPWRRLSSKPGILRLRLTIHAIVAYLKRDTGTVSVNESGACVY